MCPTHANENVEVRPGGYEGTLNDGVTGIGTKGLAAAIRSSHNGWQRVRLSEYPAGTAGRWADGVRAVLVRGDERLHLSIDDMIRVCTGEAGTTQVFMQHHIDQGAARQVTVGTDTPALVLEAEGCRYMELWFGDRCQARIDSIQCDIAIEVFVDVAQVFELTALQQLCSSRQ